MCSDRFFLNWIANIKDYELCHYDITFKALKIRVLRRHTVRKCLIFVRVTVTLMTVKCAENKVCYALIKCLGFGLVFNQLPEQFIPHHTKATWILLLHLARTGKTNTKVSWFSQLKASHVTVNIFIACVHIHLSVDYHNKENNIFSPYECFIATVILSH